MLQPQNNYSTPLQNRTTIFDFIIVGAGCAGLSLAMHLLRSSLLQNKTLLIIDADPKEKNDRTWCFWEKEPGLFQPVVAKEWQELWVHSSSHSKKLDMQPYTYKLVRGIDFYHYCKKELQQHPQVKWLRQKADGIEHRAGKAVVHVQENAFEAAYVFNSVLFGSPRLRKDEYWLLQHFKGWYIKAPGAPFNSSAATLMDFRCSQEQGTAFFYVLPLSASEALVEYTLFSARLLSPAAYTNALRQYLADRLKLENYQVAEEEFGVIPMTNHVFQQRNGNIINIGTAGGQTKGSTGYTFRYIQKQSAAIVKNLQHHGTPFPLPDTPRRFRFYDSVLLNILHRNSVPGDRIFSTLFEKNKAHDIFSFLDNESSPAQDLRIISSLPVLPFATAALRHLLTPHTAQ